MVRGRQWFDKETNGEDEECNNDDDQKDNDDDAEEDAGERGVTGG